MTKKWTLDDRDMAPSYNNGVKFMTQKWDDRFMALAQLIATWSKDPSTQVGAVVVDQKRRLVGAGFNGFARGVSDTLDRYNDRECKYKLIVHAEVNALLNAARTEGCTLYCTFCPCSACASMIVQAGIVRVVYAASPADERWGQDQRISKDIFIEGGVECVMWQL